jgi:putative ABC transport system permease protein
MSLWKLALRGLLFYRRTNLGVFLSVLAGTAVLTGALLTGDSIRFSLAQMANSRLGKIQIAIPPANRFFTEDLANRFQNEFGALTAPVLQLNGLITNSDGTKGASRVNVLGVNRRFFELGPVGTPDINVYKDKVVLNEPLANKLGAKKGDQIVLRIEKPTFMPREAALTPVADLTEGYRLEVGGMADVSQFGRFSLKAEQLWPLNVFVPLNWLQEKTGRAGQANMLLARRTKMFQYKTETAIEYLKKCWHLEDAELELRKLEKQGVWELRSKKVFIDSIFCRAALNASKDSTGIFTYFVNEIRSGDKVTPYSMVAAMDKSAGGLIPPDMQDNQIIINQWLADDLAASAGDRIELTYYVLDSMRKIQQQSTTFTVRSILPMDGPAVDPELMPDFPGLADVNNCRDWTPGVDIDLDKIRTKDQQYWDKYKGTPKAFITLSVGQKIWANRYGDLTAVRYPLAVHSGDDIAAAILKSVEPANAGLFFQPVAKQAQAALNSTTDFGMLFLGLSMFVIISALILTGLVFVFGVQSRSEQIGLLLAVGLKPFLVRNLLLIEGGLICFFGALVGIAAGLIYTRLIILGLSTIWTQAVGFSQILFHAGLMSLLYGFIFSSAVSIAAIWLSLRGLLKKSARELISGSLRWEQFIKPKPDHKPKSIFRKVFAFSKGRFSLWLAAVAAVIAIIMIILSGKTSSGNATETFFFAGFLLLIATLGFTGGILKIIAGHSGGVLTSLAGLSLRNSTRRRGRSLAVVMLLACGVFMVISVSANKTSPQKGIQSADSGTGGFSLYGESTIPLLAKLDSNSAIIKLGLDEQLMQNVAVVSMRLHQGDDASCLNLNRPQMPQVLGIEPSLPAKRGSFSFSDFIPAKDSKSVGWELLNANFGDDIVPAAGDYNTIVWSLGKKLGDTIDYVDDRGSPFKLKIVAIVKSSILQGSLIISNDEFLRRFPSDEGYRVFLIDAPQTKATALAEHLTIRLADYAMELTDSSARLAQFMAMENTYLSIFGMLGALGLFLGSIGLGLVVLRNVLERRGELAMLRAVGFNRGTIKKMLFEEHAGLAICGLFFGSVSAMLSVVPALKSRPAQMPFITIFLLAVSALFWIWLAAYVATPVDFIDALRDE